ncbi:N-acetyl sugar amidotransferase [Spirulina subsalsa FACHB-351]|uniref:N-acetyl sugar amidotransferase n=1 Tax=Spirulina subsalsa FACHB-351 TaxID=234711 RepID=A0ABT3LA98_9CYAN|nr:N-acetyl sugar amidotransferase [Spirulina subsalsa]MCW6037900.1 N-acetyl sugar amidotransferase [Spirulina subsalsa FACHB-351]
MVTDLNKKVFWCKNCLNMSTRPRISFDERGWCNACQWMEEKQVMDWSVRKRELQNILNRYRSKTGGFDCLVPVSGGKDGSYVSYQLKHKYGMNPLAVTVTPALSLELGNRNLRNYIESGYNHIQISPDAHAMSVLNRQGFIEKGFPYFGWLIAIQAAVVRLAIHLNIPLLFYGEDGEVEYGGSTESKNRPMYDIHYMKRIYLEGGYEQVLRSSGLSDSELYFFLFPTDEELESKELNITHWSYFESWDPYRNYLTAKEHCGLEEATENNAGTFTNFAQNDQALYALHTYMMYLKFGFGRATQDAGIEIRRGAMTREQAVNLVQLYDGHYPEEFIPDYLEYYQMTQQEFDDVLDKWANRYLFEKVNNRWTPKFTIE